MIEDRLLITAAHPVLQCHHVLGQPVLPGLAYIDLLYQLFRDQGYDYTRLELRHLTIYTPLAATAYPVEITITCTPVTPERWQVTVTGTVMDNNPAPVSQRYASAEMWMHAVTTQWEDTPVMPEWRGEVSTAIDIDAAYQIYSAQQVIHSGWMKAAGTINFTSDTVWMELQVPEEGQDSALHFMFHPVLIDGSAVGSVLAAYAWANGTQQLFLPLYYESFRASSLLQASCLTRIRTSDMVSKNELVQLSFAFFNESGQQVAALNNFTAKLVRDAAFATATPTPAAAAKDIVSNKEAVAAIDYLRSLWAARLQKPATHVPINSGYYEMGLDSAALLDIVSTIGQRVQQSLPPTLLFEYTTLSELADYLFTQHPGFFTASAADKTTTQPATVGTAVHAATADEGIAIISLAGRYPGAPDIDTFWTNLCEGKDAITTVPTSRWDHTAYVDDSGTRLDSTRCQWGGFLEDIDKFDPLFFHIAPAEAALIDPQERLFLETVWTLLERAGYSRRSIQQQYQSKVGVFAGAMYQQYQLLPADLVQGAVTALQAFAGIANRVSYWFNFQGPSIGLDTMCSSSMAAIHLACESLRRGECRLAVAGGVNLTLDPKKYIGLSISGLLGSTAGSRSFSDGDGFLPAEAVGAVLLKPLSAAVEDGDKVLAVIRSTTISHGGNSGGYTVPGVNSQYQMITDDIARAGIDPHTISYVEAAANGSALGDVIEVAALTKAFNKYAIPIASCAIGAVKSNIGHAEAASGISQLTKVALQLTHKTLVPTILSHPLNPKIEFGDSPFYLQEKREQWISKQPGVPLRAMITSLGAGGANAHIVIEEFIDNHPGILAEEVSPQVLVYSARNKERLHALISLHLQFLQHADQSLSLSAMAYTLQEGREEMEERLAFVATDLSTVQQALQAYLDQDATATSTYPRLFTGSLVAGVTDIDPLFEGETGAHMLRALLAAADLEKLASCWVRGCSIPWQQLYPGGAPQMLILPTYPFERRHCWIKTVPVTRDTAVPAVPVAATDPDMENAVTEVVARLIGITPEELNPDLPLQKLGFDSIYATRLLQFLQGSYGATLDMERFWQCVTLRDVWAILPATPLPAALQPVAAATSPAIRFPELLHMNNHTTGRPVFWIHAVTGGVEVYHHIAGVSARPFYGIQARGWMSDRVPLQGVHAMAAYYVHIIQSIQPQGPYDLGGYSVGGVLSFEVTRQLQELGETVNSIVMLDSLYVEDWESPELKLPEEASLPKLLAFQTVNMMITVAFTDPAEIAAAMIHRDTPDWDLEEDAFMEQLIAIAHERGVTKSTEQLKTLVRQSVKTQEAYAITDYHFGDLPDPEGVTCYYFRNRNGEFLGALKPYFALWDEQSEQLGKINYWEGWEQRFAHMYLMDVNAVNHMQLLSDPPAAGTILSFCTALYSGEELSPDFLSDFLTTTLQKHGSRPPLDVAVEGI
ncbi:polyketide synthase dehydratase domain-containing protein [Chitinophaga pendula]|uniref:beta-ketoacyl synthase N-terminal-like domain-containing protein n=1 Tax=Chitinophaga TaxID=79328 RepID=UPI000BAEA28D|nr:MULTISPECIES: beta-ketoacyl synthase N-terminal-like domain-containing protein [Chitinophaga]ASZ12890.1 hypothetical protein CK934_18975 [Chitinophaga sp. MD30]UCJ09481.1 polyketide synthase dehydratase domain-containing protein [Chitinophaga pendula]